MYSASCFLAPRGLALTAFPRAAPPRAGSRRGGRRAAPASPCHATACAGPPPRPPPSELGRLGGNLHASSSGWSTSAPPPAPPPSPFVAPVAVPLVSRSAEPRKAEAPAPVSARMPTVVESDENCAIENENHVGENNASLLPLLPAPVPRPGVSSQSEQVLPAELLASELARTQRAGNNAPLEAGLTVATTAVTANTANVVANAANAVKSGAGGCFKCGGEGHWARDCPTNRIQQKQVDKTSMYACFRCGQKGAWWTRRTGAGPTSRPSLSLTVTKQLDTKRSNSPT